MKRSLAIALGVALLAPASFAAAADGPDTTGLAAFLAVADRPVVLSVPGMDRVRVQANLTYRTAARKPLLADVYLPASPSGRPGIVVLVHGGVGPELPVRPKDWGVYRSWGRLLAASGLIAVTYNHRLGFPEPELESAAADLDSVLAFVRARGAGWGADTGRVALMTVSAGGMLLAKPIRESPRWLRGIVALYPIIDLRVSEHLKKFVRADQLAAWSAGTALADAASRMPPLLLVRAGRDQIPDLLAGVDRFVQEALAADAPVVLVNHPEAPHGFDNKEADPRTLEVLRLIVAFLRERLASA